MCSKAHCHVPKVVKRYTQINIALKRSAFSVFEMRKIGHYLKQTISFVACATLARVQWPDNGNSSMIYTMWPEMVCFEKMHKMQIHANHYV